MTSLVSNLFLSMVQTLAVQEQNVKGKRVKQRKTSQNGGKYTIGSFS